MVNHKSKVIAIIPARGGSKRIPRKNIIPFMGKPLIAWTIEAAQKAGIFDRIIVSTDDPEIAEISVQLGAEVPQLRDLAADDHAPVSEATLHTLNQLESAGDSFDVVVQLFAVCPLRTSATILDAFNHFNKENLDFLISCYKYTWMNPWWAVTLDKHQKPSWVFDNTKKRSQDLPELYSPTGAIWIAKVKSLQLSKNFYGPEHIFWEMDWKQSVDIDNYEDLDLAEALFHVINKK
ncbi:MAG: acylneuraminate cytidylyltransferase family protein [Bacteroidia bacterium]